MKQKRFFFHFRKSTGDITLHWQKKCIPVDDIICNVPIETKWNKQQPRVVIQGFATDIRIEDKIAIIN